MPTGQEDGAEKAITHQSEISAALRQPRAEGAVSLSVVASARGTELDRFRQEGALKALFPQRRGPACQAVLVNSAGGITGGDRFATRAHVARGAELTLTTQAAERAYAAQPGQTGRVTTRLTAGPGARLNWLPQETILFDRSDLSRHLVVELAGDARLTLVEPLIYGRQAMGERLRNARFRDRIELRQDGVPVYLDATRLRGDITAHLARPTIAAGAGAMAQIVHIGPDAEAALPAVRALLPDTAGASLIRPDLLAIRLLAPDGFGLRQSLVPILEYLTGQDLPRPWML